MRIIRRKTLGWLSVSCVRFVGKPDAMKTVNICPQLNLMVAVHFGIARHLLKEVKVDVLGNDNFADSSTVINLVQCEFLLFVVTKQLLNNHSIREINLQMPQLQLIIT